MANVAVTPQDVMDLINYFQAHSYEAGAHEPGSMEYTAIQRCAQFFKLDYSCIELDNGHGKLCARYPERIFIPEAEHSHMTKTITASTVNILSSQNSSSSSSELDNTTSSNTVSGASNTSNSPFNSLPPQPSSAPQNHRTIYEDLCDITYVNELIMKAKYARCRQRFVVPVIMYRGKYICRSATVSVSKETYGRKVCNYAVNMIFGATNSNGTPPPPPPVENNENVDPSDGESLTTSYVGMGYYYEDVLKADVQLLDALNVNTIVDLMVENCKVKYFLTVSSSEKMNPCNMYGNVNILGMPYPGCEFFLQFRGNDYSGQNLQYDWEQSFNDAKLRVPSTGLIGELNINWEDYKKWDVMLLTTNYLKAILKRIQEGNSGLLVHCISGWDRTPLFISLLRLSLWADGLIHESLTPVQMTYLTVAYDWFLFGHQLVDRLKRREEIMVFCFHVLKYISDEEFSIVEHRKRAKTPQCSGGSVSLMKQEEDSPPKEDLLMNLDEASGDSFLDVPNCDIQMNEGFFGVQTPASAPSTANSRSPNSKRVRTSPISVPGGGAPRQRNESTSSNNSNCSWHMVTDTGSIDSTAGNFMKNNCSDSAEPTTNNSNDIPACGSATSTGSAGSNASSMSTLSAHSSSSGSPFTPLGGEEPGPSGMNGQAPHTKSLRQHRLDAVRAIFFRTYGKAVGLKFKDGSDGSVKLIF